MKKSFEIVKLFDVCNSETSNLTLKNLENNVGEYALYGASGFIKNIDFYKQDKEYIGVVKDGAGIGRVMLLEKNSSILGTMQYIIPKENINIKYLYYNLIKMNLSKYFTGSTIPHIYFKDYKNEKILLREKSEQKKISDVLDKISIVLEMKKQQVSELDRLVKFQFLKMFDLPNSNKYNFKLGTIRDYVSSIQYGTSKPATLNGRYKYLHDMNKISIKKSINLENHYINNVKYNELKRFEVKPLDFIMSCRGTIGEIFQLPENAHIGIIHPSLMKIRINNLKYNYTFFEKILYNITKKEITIGQANINTAQELQNIKILIPPIELQNKFAEFVKQVDKSKVELQKSIDETQLLFDSLMDRYFG